VLRGGAAEHATVRPAPAPAPTILGNVGKNGGWVWERPATTIAGDPRCFQPGGHHEPGQQSENAIRLTLPEGLILQGFPPDYPVQGTKTSQWLQVGNAIPPPLAKAILAQLVPAREAAT
jgi:DNA (cytosine-5)-methyltransferase 1